MHQFTNEQMGEIIKELRSGTMGSFAGYIGDALSVADSSNLQTIAEAFPQLIQQAWNISQGRKLVEMGA